jgi:2-phosphoglycerate kinase
MLYIIGGASRTGKSMISRELMTKTGIPCFSLDVLMIGLANGLPEYGINPDDPEFRNAEKMWPILRSMLINMIETGTECIVEGYTIFPEHVNEIMSLFPEHVKSCFLGYAEINPEKKLEEIRKYSDLPNDWAKTTSDRDVLELIKRSIRYSRFLKTECEKYEILYFDQSEDFTSTKRRVIEYLDNQD